MSARLKARAAPRAAEIAGVAAGVLDEIELPTPFLVAGDDDGAVVAAAGAGAVVWRRLAHDGSMAQAWPPEGLCQGGILRVPQGRVALEMTLHAVASRLAEAAPLWIYGGNDEGITSVPNHLDGLFEGIETVTVKRRSRVYLARRSATPARGLLEDWRESVDLGDGQPFVSYPGLFAHGRIDAGSECLIKVLPTIKANQRVLDFGCGAGVLARAVRAIQPEAALTLLDVDALALDAAARNVEGAERVLSDGWSALDPRQRFDLIVSNPPIHRGHGEDFSILEALMAEGAKRLKPSGALIAVVQRTAGIGKRFQTAFRHTERLAETPHYEVWRGAGILRA